MFSVALGRHRGFAFDRTAKTLYQLEHGIETDIG
jgi:hypothetical protein